MIREQREKQKCIGPNNAVTAEEWRVTRDLYQNIGWSNYEMCQRMTLVDARMLSCIILKSPCCETSATKACIWLVVQVLHALVAPLIVNSHTNAVTDMYVEGFTLFLRSMCLCHIQWLAFHDTFQISFTGILLILNCILPSRLMESYCLWSKAEMFSQYMEVPVQARLPLRSSHLRF